MKCDEIKPIDLECNMGKDINGVEHREPRKAYDIDEVNAAIAELKAENKKLKASSEQIMNEMIRKVLIYPHEMVSLEDAYKLAVSLKNTKRALLLARAERYKMREFIAREEGNLCNQMSWSRILRERTYEQWVDQLLRIANLANKLQYKCRAKAEEYK